MTEGRLPDFLIIGAMRSGTTSLYRYLGAHPGIFMAPKELQFFTEHFDAGLAWYRTQFAAAGERQAGEATADYLARQSAIERIAATLPDVRLISSLRSPVDRTWSHYWLLRERGREERPFDTVIESEIEAIRTGNGDAPGIIYLPHSRYDVHLERLTERFPADRLHTVVFERMAADPERTYRELCRFLDVDENFVPPGLGRQVNRYVTFRSLRVRRVSQSLPQPLARLVARANTRTSGSYPELPESTRTRLNEFFAPTVASVEELIGQGIPEWRS